MVVNHTTRLLGLAADCAARAKSSPADAYGAITLSVTALDHYLHYVPEIIKFIHITDGGQEALKERTDGFLMLQELNERRSSIETRVSALLFVLTGRYPKWGDDIFQNLACVIRIRNQIIHLSIPALDTSTPPSAKHPGWVKRLTEKKVMDAEIIEWMTSDQVAERHETARWVVKTVMMFFEHLAGYNASDHFITGIFHPESPFKSLAKIKTKLA